MKKKAEKEEKNISREIFSDNHSTESIQEEEVIQSNNLQQNFTFDKNIRINNCFFNVKKEYLTKAKEKIKKIIEENSENSFLLSMLVDCEVVAASDNIYIISSSLDSIVNLININHKLIEQKLENIKIVGLTKSEWQQEKNNYINNIKNGIKYKMIDEKEDKKEIVEKNIVSDSIEDIAKQLFSSSKIEVE